MVGDRSTTTTVTHTHLTSWHGVDNPSEVCKESFCKNGTNTKKSWPSTHHSTNVILQQNHYDVIKRRGPKIESSQSFFLLA